MAPHRRGAGMRRDRRNRRICRRRNRLEAQDGRLPRLDAPPSRKPCGLGDRPVRSSATARIAVPYAAAPGMSEECVCELPSWKRPWPGCRRGPAETGARACECGRLEPSRVARNLHGAQMSKPTGRRCVPNAIGSRSAAGHPESAKSVLRLHESGSAPCREERHGTT